MRSKMMQWESDPLFSAAEVVQDSADSHLCDLKHPGFLFRMESTFRLLLHEQSLVQRDHTDTRVLTSIEHNQRDLTTALETAKWQEASNGSYNENGSWDLEAYEAKDKNNFQSSKLRGYCRIMDIFGSLGNLLSVYGSMASRSFAKRLKDGEEQMHSPPSPEMQVSCHLKLLEQHGERNTSLDCICCPIVYGTASHNTALACLVN